MSDDGTTPPKAFPPESSTLPWRTPGTIKLNAPQTLTIEQALAMLPDGDEIPVLVQEGTRQATTHMPRALIVGAIRTGGAILTGPRAQAHGYGMAYQLINETVFIKTKKEETP